MALTPITRRLVPDDVFEQLLDEVVDGGLSPGDALPSERRLSELLGVSRPAVREALQRLSATRLLEVRHGGATTVRDFQRYAGLDLLPRLLVRNGELDPAIARSIVEARLAIGPTVASLAAARHHRAGSDALGAAVDVLADAPDSSSRQRAALAFWDEVVDLADSVVFRMMFNSLRLAYEPAIDALAPLLDAEVGNIKGYRALTAAITAGNETRARREAEKLLGPASDALVDFLRAIEAQPDESEEGE